MKTKKPTTLFAAALAVLLLSAPSGGAGPYADWASSKGLNGTNDGFDQNPDGDQLANGLEWILGGDPLVHDATGLWAAAGDTGGLSLSFTREEDSIGELSFYLDWDVDLDGTWAHSIPIIDEVLPSGDNPTVVIDTAVAPDAVTVNIPGANAVSGRIFARLRATQSSDPIFVGHRGLITEAPENTLPAFVTAAQLGIGIELDVRTSSDGELVVIHDNTIGRTTAGTDDFPVSQVTLAQLKSYDAGSWMAPRFAGTKIPTFEETLAAIAQECPTILAINIKGVSVAGEQTLVDLVDQYGLLEESYAFDISPVAGARMKAHNPNFRIGETVRSSAELNTMISNASTLPDVLHIADFMPSQQQVDDLRAAGTQSILNRATAEGSTAGLNPAVWNTAKQLGVDGILNNHPVDGIEAYGQTKAVVNLYLEVDEVAKTWLATADVVGGDTDGIAAIPDFDVVGAEGIVVSSSAVLPLASKNKINDHQILYTLAGTYTGDEGTLSISALANSTSIQPEQVGGSLFLPEAVYGRTVSIGQDSPASCTGSCVDDFTSDTLTNYTESVYQNSPSTSYSWDTGSGELNGTSSGGTSEKLMHDTASLDVGEILEIKILSVVGSGARAGILLAEDGLFNVFGTANSDGDDAAHWHLWMEDDGSGNARPRLYSRNVGTGDSSLNVINGTFAPFAGATLRIDRVGLDDYDFYVDDVLFYQATNSFAASNIGLEVYAGSATYDSIHIRLPGQE